MTRLDPTSVAEATTTPGGESSAGVTARGVLAALPDFALAAAFLATWVEPYAFGETAVQYLLLTMILEFIIVHSSGFMGTAALAREARPQRLRTIFGYGLFYTMFVGGFALAFSTWWPVYAFWGLTLNRMLGILLGDAPEGAERQYIRAGWALAAIYYLGAVFVTAWMPLPALGLTPDVLAALDLPGSGQWIEQPHRVLAFGFLYFSLSGAGEVLGWARSERFLKGVPAEPA